MTRERTHISYISMPACLSILMLAWSTPALSDTVRTRDGSVLQGKVSHMTDGKVQMTTSFAGEIEIAWEEIVSIETGDALPIHLDDGSVIQGTLQSGKPGTVDVVRESGEARFSTPLNRIVQVNPPPPPTPDPVKWQSKITGSASESSSDTDVSAVGITAEGTRRTEADRITLKGGYYTSETDGDTKRDDQFVSGKYDYFITKQYFSYLNARMDRDKVKDIDLRLLLGMGLGYQFVETDPLNIFGEMGGSYVNENFETSSDDESYAALRSAYHVDWWLIEDRLRLAQDAELLLGLEDTDDWLAITTSSLSWKWTERWSSEASIRYDYDNTPAEGRDKDDFAYMVGFGLSF